ncbi:Protein ERP3 [Nakaseomyces bracarensis]|uniref:Protein ERP3 n=1 Tax=Nakaseomyces bracarensis TaxID=273131 RepID=A0ABR4NWC6_9SACH
MKFSLVLAGLFALVNASPLTFELEKGQRQCFHTLTTKTDCTIEYFYEVLSGTGNDLNVQYEVFEPGNLHEPIVARNNEKKGHWAFTATHKGEYTFCFYGGKSHDKIVDLEITSDCGSIIGDARSQRRNFRKNQRGIDNQGEKKELKTKLEDSIDKIERQLYSLENNLEYYKTRNDRNHATVRSTEKRITTFSFYGILLIVGMSLGQIAVLQFVFKESRKQKV